VITKVEVDSPVQVVLNEFYTSGDEKDTAASFKELVPVEAHAQFVKKLLIFAMERQAFEREHASRLLSYLYNKELTPTELIEGFQSALDAVDDFTLDVVNGVDYLAKFLARAIVDEVIPPAFLKNAHTKTAKAKEVITLATGLVTEKHGSARLCHIWGPGDLSSVKRLKEEVSTLIGEYFTNDDAQEAYNSIRNLNAPSFHPQLVKQAVRYAFEHQNISKISSLLKFLSETGLISTDHTVKGVKMILATKDDIKLDVPNVDKLLPELVVLAKQDKWLPADFEP